VVDSLVLRGGSIQIDLVSSAFFSYAPVGRIRKKRPTPVQQLKCQPESTATGLAELGKTVAAFPVCWQAPYEFFVPLAQVIPVAPLIHVSA
jgi:hypothetical protein